MIGNDVIDLNLARTESNWQRPGLMQKIFTAREQLFLQQSQEPERWFWILWSRKEAAYKIVNRELSLRAFIPHLLECSLDCEIFGTVQYKEFMYATYTEIDGDCLHTIAVANRENFGQYVEISKTLLSDDDLLPAYNLQPATVSHHGRFEKVLGFATEGQVSA